MRPLNPSPTPDGSAERETVVIVVSEAEPRQIFFHLLQEAGYEVVAFESDREGIEIARSRKVDLFLLDANNPGLDCCNAVTEMKGAAATRDVRVLLLTGEDSAERARALDLGADDAVARSADPAELLARVRAQLRARRELAELREKMRIAEQGQQIAHTAFQALAVTEKMTHDAFSLDRKLRTGVTALLVVAVLMAGTYFIFFRSAKQQSQRYQAVIAQLQRGIMNQEDLLDRSRRTREELERSAASSFEQQRQRLEAESQQIRERMNSATEGEVAELRKQLNETGARLRRIESAGRMAQGIIRSSSGSVCLLHVVVAFRDKASGQRLRYAGVNPQGEPLQDSAGNPIFSLQGRGPEVRTDFFGTGFLVAADGRILTNRHVVEPWWKSDELRAIEAEGMEAVISEISAYFPDAPRAFRVEIMKISPTVDLAVVKGDLGELKRAPLALDGRADSAVTGQPVVLIGYATGLEAILARAGEETLRNIVAAAGGNPRQIMAELERRNLIRPLTTQGHIGDVLADKIVYDAQTTSGGSGGPVFNAQGKVIGVNFAVIRGFGGSNFGIPIRFAEPLLK
jgi:DNA-binding response OmpR family regulator/S1-C subfamily serine protease